MSSMQRFLKPRLFEQTFDDKGPGQLSGHGYRHDNDHVNIRHIQILPTMDEILSQRPPFMPRKDVTSWHFLPRGVSRLIDTQFRQLRYDSIESVIDSTYYTCQLLASSCILDASENFHVTPKGNRFRAYYDITFEGLGWHNYKGLEVEISFACPPHLQGWKLSTSDVLERGMLVALVGLDLDSPALSTIFFEVSFTKSAEGMRSKGNGVRANMRMCLADPENEDDCRRVLYYSQSIQHGKFILVEYPGVLPAGFMHTLKRLQHPDTQLIPFSQEIAPGNIIGRSLPGNEPPAYAIAKEFTYNLTSLRTPGREFDTPELRIPLSFSASDSTESLSMLLDQTSLDEGQAAALLACLNRGLAFTQGPPGTGKTYLGVALVKAILASRPENAKWPIVVACMTNHALDSFLRDLCDQGVQNIVRLGAGSKQKWTESISLWRARKSKIPGMRFNRWKAAIRRVEGLTREGDQFCQSFSMPELSWHVLREYIQENYNGYYQQFASLEAAGSEHGADNSLARKAEGFGFMCWIKEVDINAEEALLRNFHLYLGKSAVSDVGFPIVQQMLKEIFCSKNLHIATTLGEPSIWQMSSSERQQLVERWRSEVGTIKLVEQVAELHRRHQEARQNEQRILADNTGVQLKMQDVIGVTTTGSAMYSELLKIAGPKVVICEEAGEVMEPHTLCTLSPTIEHGIFIGDPEQLRPQAMEQSLSLETKMGVLYRLDESLFERLMKPADPETKPIPTTQLSIQRRMFPDIADLSRATLYPSLQDHISTTMHDPVAGMVRRMYWLDHTEPEDESGADSYSNPFEAEMIRGLVRYLISQNHYGVGDIAVVTPYKAQLSLLQTRLHAQCSVYLSQADIEQLQEDELITEGAINANSLTDVDMFHLLRTATIDNFQGEEARVVILSTVRSNSEGRVGFLRTENRVNVACSRARDGFYIIGNAGLIGSVNMWAKIIKRAASEPLLPHIARDTPFPPTQKRYSNQEISLSFNRVESNADTYSNADMFAIIFATQRNCISTGSAKNHASVSALADTIVQSHVMSLVGIVPQSSPFRCPADMSSRCGAQTGRPDHANALTLPRIFNWGVAISIKFCAQAVRLEPQIAMLHVQNYYRVGIAVLGSAETVVTPQHI
ncbi:hypothetical protein FGG08_002226 [Glutinoglossum americanum]|uniref:P-loop containing nucleoside triphosphate hydrolase protein n=1 Tax=Glutinoglossum americanum TaxID=1670608 RepID=A0A9P8L4N9_9PEZI|nr:hypothetical protein FGG08_002226 [Glutinoglossum americanum]